MSTLLDIGASLAAARRAARVSQRQLAERLGTSQQQIARWEAREYRSASLEHVAAVAKALGVDASAADAQPLLAAEPVATYGTATVAAVSPVSDLGEVAARIREHAAEFKAHGVSRIGVFGSFAVGEQTAASDVDLLVDYVERPEGFAFFDAPALAERILGRKVDWTQPRLLKDRLGPRILTEVIYVWEA
jgi:uncharacterized protein